MLTFHSDSYMLPPFRTSESNSPLLNNFSQRFRAIFSIKTATNTDLTVFVAV